MASNRLVASQLDRVRARVVTASESLPHSPCIGQGVGIMPVLVSITISPTE